MPPTPLTPSRAENALARVGYLGPEGTFSEEALLASVRPGAVQLAPQDTIHDAVMAVQEGAARWSLVPIENSIEGSVTATLDALAREAPDVAIVGELVLAVRQCLIAVAQIELTQIETVVSHPQATAQCAQFLREQLPQARVLAATSTAEAVRRVAEAGHSDWAALGPRLAAERYGCVVLRAGVEDRADNETRFVWLGRGDDAERPPLRDGRGGVGDAAPGEGAPDAAGEGVADAAGDGVADARRAGALKTSLLFWGPGADGPGWLVACLAEFAQRDVNLNRIESRPQRERLGRYVFFVDLDGGIDEAAVGEAVAGLREHCREVRVLGSYPAAG